MKRKLVFSLFAIAVCAVPLFAALRPQRPNVVLIIIDTLRADALGSNGNQYNASPELDELAMSGTYFTNAYSQSSWTRPSHGSFLTSRYPRSVGIYKEDGDILQDKFTTLAEVFGKAGYRTVGLTANPHLNRAFNFHQGFDVYVDSNVNFDAIKSRGAQLLRADEMYTRALAELDRLKRQKPVFLQINIMDVHTSSYRRIGSEDIDPPFRDSANGRYLQAVREASKATGTFIQTLRSRAGWGNTLVAIVADHGEGLHDFPGLRGGKEHGYLLYDSLLHVPFILSNPSDTRLQARRFDRQVRLIDLMPTLLHYADVRGPKDMDGVSLVPLVEGGSVEFPEMFVAETNWRTVNKIAAISETWRFIENRDRWKKVNPQELQKSGDPQRGIETDKISAEPHIAAKMEQFLEQWEKSHPKHPAMRASSEALSKAASQLKSLGYLK